MLMLSRAARTPACLRWSARPMKSLGDAAKEQPHLEKTPITSQLWERRKLLLKIGDETTPVRMTSHKMIDKTVGQSRMEILYNFTEDASLRHLYVDCNGEILMGKLFEDLDALAGNVAAVHCDDGDSTSVPLSLVTASVDKITQMKKIDTTKNYVLIGQMAFVGNSSMDILIQMQHSAAASSCLLRCFFTYVAKDPFMGKSVSVNRLIAQTPEEQVLYDFREKLASTRRSASIRFEEVGCRSSLTSLVERGSAMADMPALAHPNAVLMSQTELENCFLCQPQNVNTADKYNDAVHRAYDLAVATCYTFAGTQPRFLEVDKIEFRKPVDIGDLVRLKSRVVYSSDDPLEPIAQVEVICQIVRPERASSYISNKFQFVFAFGDHVTLKRVLPQTFEQAETLIRASKWIKQ